jgi:hypothetical protein
MPGIANDNAAARRGTRREAAGSPMMDGPGLARRVKADLRAQGLRRVLVDEAVLRQLAGPLLGPDEDAERARRRDTAERELAGMELRWTRRERLDHPERLSGCHTVAGGVRRALRRPRLGCPQPIVPAGARPAGWELPC